MSGLKSAWCRPARSTVAHFFKAGRTRSICGQWFSRGVDAEVGAVRCAKCRKMTTKARGS